MKTFEGKVVLVTGATSGLGETAALAFARAGAGLVLAGRRADRGEALAARIQAAGGTALFVATDVGVTSQVEALFERALARFGRLDAAVNAAGVSGPVMQPLADIDAAEFDALINVNLTGVWRCMKHEIRAMLANGGGAIVNVASIYGLEPSDLGHSPYAASKHAVIGLTRSAAVDYGQQGIRVNAIAPGFTHSEMVDPYVEAAPALMESIVARHSAQNRLGRPEESAEAITWLCSDAASFVNGAVLTIDGGGTTRLY